ncbi:MAG: Hsp70 family protein [Pirellulales bacterium]
MSFGPPENAADRQPPVGIDLGTTYSVLAYVDAMGRPVTVANAAGEQLTPSAVLVDEDAIVVGREAARVAMVEPAAYADCFKRDIGRSTFRRHLLGLLVPPEVLSAFVLDRLKQDAEQRLGPIRQAVITVPAFFDEGRRRATQEAGALAGLHVLDIINEPTAAAVAFGYQHGFLQSGPSDVRPPGQPSRLLVYDLGGGTFDVTILEIEGTRFRTLATDGDVQLGGRDFDGRLVDHIAERFVAAHGTDPRSDPRDATQLWLDSQELKHTLSARSRANLVCHHAGVRMRVEVTRPEFEEMTRDLLERTEMTTSLVAHEARLGWSQMDRVLLVGGSSRMPMVPGMLERLTGKRPDGSASPDEVVAHGAALYAAMLMREGCTNQCPEMELVNVNSHSLGVVGLDTTTGRRINATLIPKNSPLPCQKTRTFQTARDDQRSVMVSVVEGESRRPDECIPLGECAVRDLPLGLPKGTPIEVEYRYAANGRISVSARVPSTRQSARVEINREACHPLQDLDTWRHKLMGKIRSTAQGFTAESAADSLDPSDRGSVLRRLDARYIQFGRAIREASLPEGLARSQQAARETASAYEAHLAAVKTAHAAKRQATSQAELVRSSSELAHARTRAEQTNTQAEFALLVLGRDGVQHGLTPPGTETLVQEIQHLRGLLERYDDAAGSARI